MMWRKWPSFERAWSRYNIELPKEILPSAGWAEDSNSHYLLISLPGFEQDDIKIQVEDDPARIKISGQMKKNKKSSSLVGNNITFFNKTYTIPDNNADVRSASGKLGDGGIFTVTISKKNINISPPLTVDPPEEDHQVAADKDDEHVDKESDTKSSPAYRDDQNTKKKLLDQNSRSRKHSGVEENEDDENDHHGAAEVFNKNKGMIFTLLAAFALGMLVSRKVDSRRRCNYQDKLPNSLLNT